MRFTSSLVASALAIGASAGKNYLGFNSGATLADRSAKFKADFEAEFKTAQGLEGAPGKFNAVRLYTNIQAYSQDDPIQAFEAAIGTQTYMLLGVWASGTDNINKEISALKKAVTTYGSKFTDLVIGISIGSEDLYRNSVTGVKNKAGVGNSPDALVGFIKDFKKAFADNPLGKIPVGHVDTWDVWPNATNKAVLDAVDWIGVDEYPYYENGKGNDIKNAGTLFDRAYDATIAAANGKPVWVTETGWPATGPDWDQAKATVENAKYYWDEIGCRKLFNKTPTFWYNLRDSNPDNTMKFAITKDLSTTPLFNLTCPATFDTKPKSLSETSKGSASATDKPTGTGSFSTAMTTATATGS
ncbi:putative glucan endo-1,3-beta-glucosidase eglC, partial [Tolypocladium ophioglossoides CBS 100239]